MLTVTVWLSVVVSTSFFCLLAGLNLILVAEEPYQKRKKKQKQKKTTGQVFFAPVTLVSRFVCIPHNKTALFYILTRPGVRYTVVKTALGEHQPTEGYPTKGKGVPDRVPNCIPW